MADRLIERQRLPAPKPAMLPAISRMAPASWLRELRFVVPGAPLIRPPALVAITACSDKLRVSTIANALAGDARRSQRHLMRPFLVVEHEAMFGLGALNEHASRNVDVLRVSAQSADVQGERHGVVERLAHVGQRFVMHILMQQRQAEKVQIAVAIVRVREFGAHRIQHGASIIAQFSE